MSEGPTIRMRSLCSEAGRDLISGTTRAALLGAVWCVLLTLLLVWNVVVTVDLLAAAEKYREAGASIFVVEATGRVDGQQCADLARLPNVHHAGALRTAERQVTPRITPGVQIPTFDATPGLISILRPETRDVDGVFLSADVGNALGVGRSTLDLEEGAAVLAGTFPYPDDGRRPVLGYSALQTVSVSGLFDQCWVDVWPESARIQSIASSTVVGGEDAGQGPPTVGQLNASLGRSFDGEAKYRERASTVLPGLLIALGASLGFFAVRIRRLELAAARLIGIRPFDQCVLLLLESGVWLVVASTVSVAVTAALSATRTSDLFSPTVEFSALSAATGMIGVLCGTLMGIASINSRRAHAYFRDR